MISLRLVAYTAGTDTRLGIMPEPTSLQLSIGHNTVGALELTYSQLADQGSLLAGGLETGLDIGVEVNWGSGWTEPPGCRFLLIKRSTNPADPARMIQLSCPSYAWLAGRVRNLNLSAVEGSKSKHAGERKFASASAGRIVKTLLDEHQDRRGAGVPLTRSGFSNTVDSASANWAKTKTLYYPVGVDILTVLTALSDIDHCDWRTQGRALQMWNADSHFTDRAATVKLQLGRELGDAPSEETMEDLVTHILVRGEKKVKTTVQNTSGPHPWGYWEGFIDEGGIDSVSEAQDAAQKELAARSRLRGEYTRTLTMSDLPGDSLPFRDYVVGDWVTGPAVVGSQRMRVQQVTVTLDSDGLLAGSVVLNDRVLAAELKRASKLKSITITGPGSTGGSGIAPIPEGPDPRQPAAPTGLTVTDTVYLDAFGMHAVRIKAVWSPVTTATDGTELDIARYELWGQPQGQTPTAVWRRITSSTGVEAEWLPFSPGSQWVFTVLAVGLTTIDPGVQSAPVTVTMGQDTVAPPAPSTPVVTAWLASVQAAWNGRDNTGAEMPADWVETRVHIGTTAGFTPSPANQVDSFSSRTGGIVNLTQATLSYTTPVYVKLVAVDLSGNVGPASAAGSATPRPAYYSDLATSAIDDIIADATDVIMPSVDGKSRITHSTATPTNYVDQAAGDTWFRYSGTLLIGMWRATSPTAWQEQTIAETWLPQVNIGSGTYGTLSGDRLLANSVTAEKMVISGGNLLPDPTLQGVAAWTVPASSTRTPTGGYAGDGIVTVPAGATLRDVVTQSTVIDNRRPYLVRVTPGLTYLVQARVKTGGGPTVASGLWVAALAIDAAGTAIGSSVPGAAIPASVAAGTWSTAQVIFTAPAGAAWMQVYLRAAAAQNTQVIWSTPWALQMASGSLIVDGSVQAKHLEAELVLTSQVIAGPPTGTHARMNPDGFSAYGPDPADDVVKSFMRLGSDGLSFGFNPDIPAARITGLGHASLASAAVGALSVGGETLNEILDPFPRGRIAYANSTSPVTGITTTETPVMELRATLAPGRLYELVMIGTAARSSVAGDIIEWAIRVEYDGGAVTTSSTAIRASVRQNLGPATLYVTVPPVAAEVSTDGQSGMREARFLLTAKRASGTGTLDIWGSASQPAQLKLRDEGPWKAATTTGVRYTSVWAATARWSHTMGGTPVDPRWEAEVTGSSPFLTTQVYFGGTGISGETAATIASAMSGASLIKAEIGAQVDACIQNRESDGRQYAYSPALRVHPTANTSSNSTVPGSYSTSAAYTPPQTRWTDVTALWTTSHRGVYLTLPPVASGRRGWVVGDWTAVQVRLTYFR